VAKTTARPEYTISAVSKLTGVSCHALRVWERRYKYPMPYRSRSGHRRYSVEQVYALRQVAGRIREGAAIGDVIADFRAGRLTAESAAEKPTEVVNRGSTSDLVDRLLAGDLKAAEVRLQELSHGLGPMELISRVIEPSLVDIGERWFRRECWVCQERCASGFLLRRLECLFVAAQQANPHPYPQRSALLGTLQGDRHEGGALILGLLLELAGWRALLLGVDIPVREYRNAIKLWRPDALGLSFVLSRNIKKRFQELEQISGLPIFVGGRSILNYQGLARRHGLLPLPGPATEAIGQFLAQFDEWSHRHAADASPG
jgi:MerR family transcriptional regulator, light-induced transcriptional regulator